MKIIDLSIRRKRTIATFDAIGQSRRSDSFPLSRLKKEICCRVLNYPALTRHPDGV
ncbi:MAG: hypothetical protein U5K69_24230 [Balneolaceae bacterium]|nr:hypothetical protein [Balneolaceae bacterium]